jgi:hypothetical protein
MTDKIEIVCKDHSLMDATIYCPTCRKSYEFRDIMERIRQNERKKLLKHFHLTKGKAIISLEDFKANVLILAKYEASWAMAKRYIDEEREKATKLGDTGKHYLLTIVLNYMKKLEKEKLESGGETPEFGIGDKPEGVKRNFSDDSPAKFRAQKPEETLKEPKDDECVICYALMHGEVDIDKKKKNYMVCNKHILWKSAVEKPKPKKEEKIMEKEECYICNKPIDPKKKEYWEWAEEPAHMECVLKTATKICGKCNYLTIDDENSCRDCGGKLRTLTEKDKERLRKSEENK